MQRTNENRTIHYLVREEAPPRYWYLSQTSEAGTEKSTASNGAHLKEKLTRLEKIGRYEASRHANGLGVEPIHSEET